MEIRMANRSDDQRKAMFANMSNPRSKRKSKRLKKPKATKSVPSSARKLPRRLPIVTITGVKYFRDNRLKEFRAVDDPHKRIPYDSFIGSIRSGSVSKGSKSTPSVLLKQIRAKQSEAVERKSKTAKFKRGSMVYSYLNPSVKREISHIRLSDDPKYPSAYKLSLRDKEGYSYSSKWIDESSLTTQKGSHKRLPSDLLEKESKRVDAMIKRKQSKEPLEGVRKHKLLTVELRKKIPKLYSQENVKDPVVHARFFSPYSGYNLHVTEFDGEDTLYGYVSGLSEGGDEWGYSSLKEIAETEKKGFPGLNYVERDRYFHPKKFSKVSVEIKSTYASRSPKKVKADSRFIHPERRLYISEANPDVSLSKVMEFFDYRHKPRIKSDEDFLMEIQRTYPKARWIKSSK